MDTVSKIVRSRNMAHIRAKNTNIEILVRKALYKLGIRYRLHYNIPGRPDIVFVTKKVAVFVNGCFWHGHNCQDGHIPKTNSYYWERKITKNTQRDKSVIQTLTSLGWNVIVIWECNIRKDIQSQIRIILSEIGLSNLSNN